MGKDQYEFLKDYWSRAKPHQNGEFHDVDENLSPEIKFLAELCRKLQQHRPTKNNFPSFQLKIMEAYWLEEKRNYCLFLNLLPKEMTSVSGHYENMQVACKALAKEIIDNLSSFLCDEQKNLASNGVNHGKYEIPYVHILTENLLKFHNESKKEEIHEKNLTDDEFETYREMKKKYSNLCKKAIERQKNGVYARPQYKTKKNGLNAF